VANEQVDVDRAKERRNARILQLYDGKISIRGIAKEVGCSKSTVDDVIRKYRR
jgi:transposase